MKNELMLELGRKFVHLSSILIIVVYIVAVETFSKQIALFILAFILIIFIEAEYIRLEFGHKLKFMKFISKFKRQKEKKHLGADVFFLIGALIVLAIFDFRVAVAAILMTTFGDLAASLFGITLGRIKIYKKKTLEGFVFGLLANLVIGFIFIRTSLPDETWFTSSASFGNPILPVIVAMALTASIVELFIDKLDDNLLIPVFSGFNGQMIMLLMGIPLSSI